jgi:glutaminyl-tRNA synthetase
MTEPDAMFKVGFLADVYQERPTDKVVSRFPPEPNGYLHVGHSKAIAVNFGFARYHGGVCYLRYDDTNPSGEKQEYFESIKAIIEWLGFKPVAITHSSDHFDRLYELAEELIRRDGAYMCHCSSA